MAEQDLERRRAMQWLELEMLKAAVSICDRHGITYYLVEGTLLGAVRHKGFIPWDDDIDIAVPAFEMDRFIAACREELPEPFYIEGAFDGGRTGYDTGLTRIYTREYKVLDTSGRSLNLSIDVQTLIGMPSARIPQTLHYYGIMFRKAMPKMCRPETIGVNYWKNKKPIQRAAIRLAHMVPFGKIFPYEQQWEKLRRCLARYSDTECRLVMLYPSAYGKKEILPRSWYGSGVPGEFEGMQVRLPERYHDILSSLYGDYMTPPPEEKRTGSHVQELIEIGRATEEQTTLKNVRGGVTCDLYRRDRTVVRISDAVPPERRTAA